ncbi:MAG TPA: hypothetical protein DCS97_06750 [Planctomycetes bacterium]|nr:hypothetical protein [Planctomycetota bacterium]
MDMLPIMNNKKLLKSSRTSTGKGLDYNRPALERIAQAADISVVAVREMIRREKVPHNRHVRAVYLRALAREQGTTQVHADMVGA